MCLTTHENETSPPSLSLSPDLPPLSLSLSLPLSPLRYLPPLNSIYPPPPSPLSLSRLHLLSLSPSRKEEILLCAEEILLHTGKIVKPKSSGDTRSENQNQTEAFGLTFFLPLLVSVWFGFWVPGSVLEILTHAYAAIWRHTSNFNASASMSEKINKNSKLNL